MLFDRGNFRTPLQLCRAAAAQRRCHSGFLTARYSGNSEAGVATSAEWRCLTQTEDSQQGFIDAPLLFGADTAQEFAQAAGVDGPDLLHEDASRLAEEVDLRPEGCWARAVRGRGD